VRSDLIATLIALEILRKEPGATIIYDPRSSRAFREDVEKAGGTAIVDRVGHAYMKATLRNKRAAFGGELSGHYYFRDFFCADNGLLALIKMLNLLSREGKPLSELVKPVSRYFHTGELNFTVEDKDAVIAAVAKKYADGRISHVDGITVEYPDWWFNLRKSNTEPLIRLNLEATTPELMAAKKAEVESLL
jgi:phosphomannomutase